MSQISKNIHQILEDCSDYEFTLVAVSKTKPKEDILAALDGGHLEFGENKVQELVDKFENLPKEIKWHMIGHLQRNKVKYIAPFVHLIHGVDSEKLLRQIDKEGKKHERVIDCLLQMHIAEEDTKFGLDQNELMTLLETLSEYQNVRVMGLMGMATNTENDNQIRKEFRQLRSLFDSIQNKDISNFKPRILSMGMSGDYKIALEEGSNMIRVGSAIFGARNYG